MNLVQHGVIASNIIEWKCAAFGSDISDSVVMEDNTLNCTEESAAALNAGNYISVYNLHSHPSSRFWSVARNKFIRPPSVFQSPHNWQFCETLTTDAPHSFNMGHVVEVMERSNASQPPAVRLSARMGPPTGVPNTRGGARVSMILVRKTVYLLLSRVF